MRFSQVCSIPLIGVTSAPFSGILPSDFNQKTGTPPGEPIKLTPLYGVMSTSSGEPSLKDNLNVTVMKNFAAAMPRSNRKPLDQAEGFQRMSSVTTTSSSSESRDGTGPFEPLKGLDFNDPLIFSDQHKRSDTAASTGSEGLPHEIPQRHFASPKLSETHFPYRQVDPSNLSYNPYSVFPNDTGVSESNGSSKQPGQAGWAFNPAMDKYNLLNPASNLEQPSNEDQMFMDMNGDYQSLG